MKRKDFVKHHARISGWVEDFAARPLNAKTNPIPVRSVIRPAKIANRPGHRSRGTFISHLQRLSSKNGKLPPRSVPHGTRETMSDQHKNASGGHSTGPRSDNGKQKSSRTSKLSARTALQSGCLMPASRKPDFP